MFSQNRQQIRQMYFDVWAKMTMSSPLSSLEKVIASVIELHPEYHALFSKPDKLDQDYFVEHGETNPYLHMGLHISLHEQVQTNRPAGIRDIYQQLLIKTASQHDADHLMIECLAESLWQAQKQGAAPSEADYLASLRALV